MLGNDNKIDHVPTGRGEITQFSAAVISHYREYFQGGVVRFMPWTLSGTYIWEQRARVGAPSYMPFTHYGEIGPGVPWETVVRFAGAVNASAWVSLPPGPSFDACCRPQEQNCSSAYAAKARDGGTCGTKESR